MDLSPEATPKPARARPGHAKARKSGGAQSPAAKRKRTGRSTTGASGGAGSTRQAGKYNATGMRIDDRWFASQAEGARYLQLKAFAQQGMIDELECQPVFRVTVNNQHICKYQADFRYKLVDDRGSVIRVVVEDVKGVVTDVYRLKKALVQATYGFEIVEIPARQVSQWASRTG